MSARSRTDAVGTRRSVVVLFHCIPHAGSDQEDNVREVFSRDVSTAVRVVGCIALPREHRMVRVAWLPRPDVLAIEAASTGLAGVLGVFSPLGLVLHPADPDAELLRLGEDADDWLPQGSSLERGLVLTAQEMKIADDRVAVGAAMP